MENLEEILSDKTKDLLSVAESERVNYLKSKPFPSIIFKNFFKDEYLSKILADFPDLRNIKKTQEYNNKNEIKFTNNKKENIPTSIQNFIKFLNSEPFVSFLQKLTSIKETLVSDQNLDGGGLHEIKNGGQLKIHTDFHLHPSLGLDRRKNVLINLNKNWKNSYGGHLELWDVEMKNCVQKIAPEFNTMVIFSTTDFSNHGHPDPLNCPSNISRKSIALYYFSNGRPKEELSKSIKNTTKFKNRYGVKNDVEDKTNFFRKIFRNFIFYDKIKKFEKKYIRTGRSAKKRE